MSDDKNKESTEDAGAEGASGTEQKSSQSGPKFEESPSPLDGVSKVGGDVWNSMEGKTVSMRTYVGSIIAVIVLMMLARCGG